MPLSASKLKHCKVCNKEFKPFQSTQKVCGPTCALQLAQGKRKALEVKEARRDIARRKEALKSSGDWLREAQAAFNSFVRERDYGKPCISCGTLGSSTDPLRGGEWDCGHYRSTGAAPHLRFNLFNVARQCKRCNRQLSGNVVEMRKGLALRIGIERLEALEANNLTKQYRISDLKRIKRIFSKRAKLYRKLRESHG